MNIGQVFGLSLYWKPRVVMTPPLSSPGALQVVITMVTCGNHSDDKVGFMIIVDFRYYTHGLVNIRITIAIHCHLPRFLESESLSYHSTVFRYASSGERPCITLGQSLWTMDQFLVTNKLQVCELCVSMFTNIWYWLNQIHVDKPHCAAIGPESSQCCKPDSAPFWHIMAHLRGYDIL